MCTSPNCDDQMLLSSPNSLQTFNVKNSKMEFKHFSILNPIKGSLYESENNRDITSRWVHREINLVFTLRSDKDQKNIYSLSHLRLLSINEP